MAIEFALNRGYDNIGWHCWNENEASAKTALKTGFRLERCHPVFHAWYNTFDNLLIFNKYLIGQKSDDEVLAIFDQINLHKDNNTRDYQN